MLLNSNQIESENPKLKETENPNIHTYIYIYIHTHTYIHTYIHKNAALSKKRDWSTYHPARMLLNPNQIETENPKLNINRNETENPNIYIHTYTYIHTYIKMHFQNGEIGVHTIQQECF